MPKSTVKLLASKEIAEGTMSFSFEKPAGFTHVAGQYIDLFEVDPPDTDAEGPKRSFSLACSPSEPELMIASRMRDTAFKRVLKASAPGTAFELDGPFGGFVLHEDSTRPAVFLTGGIGVTPVMSINKDAAERRLPHALFLFFSNKRPEDTVFLREFEALTARNPRFVMIPTMTEMEKSSQPWEGERGFINAEMLKKYLDPSPKPIYYLTGPPGMVAAMRKMLDEMKVSADDIRTEEFTGY